MNLPPGLERHRVPGPDRPFVNRRAERQLIIDKLEIGIKGEPMLLPVVCFWGAFGMGKSWLLFEIEREPLPGDQASGASHPPVAARLDLHPEVNPSLWAGERLDRTWLIRELWQQLARQLGVPAPEEDESSPEEWATRFVQQVSAWSSHSVTPLILLDSVDYLLRSDESAFRWLEQEIVERLAMTDRVLFVFTSRSELWRWQRFHVRRRVDLYRLEPFDAQMTACEVMAAEPVGPVLHRHAFGHPLATDFIRQAIEGQGVGLNDVDSIRRALSPAVILDALDQTRAEFLVDTPGHLRPLAQVASVFRRVRTEQLRCLFRALPAEDLGLTGMPDMDDLLDQLHACHLLYWNGDRKSYEMDAVVRHILAYRLELDDPASFQTAHRAAYRLQRDQLDRFPDNLDSYVPELLYHNTTLATRGWVAPEPDMWEWWEHFEAKRAPSESAPWEALAEALDKDDELQEQSPEAWERLKAIARRRADAGSGLAEGGTEHG